MDILKRRYKKLLSEVRTDIHRLIYSEGQMQIGNCVNTQIMFHLLLKNFVLLHIRYSSAHNKFDLKTGQKGLDLFVRLYL